MIKSFLHAYLLELFSSLSIAFRLRFNVGSDFIISENARLPLRGVGVEGIWTWLVPLTLNLSLNDGSCRHTLIVNVKSLLSEYGRYVVVVRELLSDLRVCVSKLRSFVTMRDLFLPTPVLPAAAVVCRSEHQCDQPHRADLLAAVLCGVRCVGSGVLARLPWLQ